MYVMKRYFSAIVSLTASQELVPDSAPWTKSMGSPEPCSDTRRCVPLIATSLTDGPDAAADGTRSPLSSTRWVLLRRIMDPPGLCKTCEARSSSALCRGPFESWSRLPVSDERTVLCSQRHTTFA